MQLPLQSRQNHHRRNILNKLLIITALSTIVFLYSCQKKVSSSDKTVSSQAQPEVTAFEPPADSLITLERMNAWLLSNTYLDSLAFMYSDSFKTLDPALRIRYQEDFTSAQNKLCVRAGLPGGYKEYTWIMKNSGNPKNKNVLDSANTAVH